MFGRALTSVFWGIVADRYGRKPIILLGTISMLVDCFDYVIYLAFVFNQLFMFFFFVVPFSMLSLA